MAHGVGRRPLRCQCACRRAAAAAQGRTTDEAAAIPELPCTRLATFASHGGALDEARRLYPLAPTPWLDLSTGINPRPFPVGEVPAEAWTRLPEAEPLARLEAAARRCYRCPPDAAVVAAPGTQAIIQRLPDLLPSGDVRVLGPTYGEFARVFAAAGSVRGVATVADLAGADVAVVVNPNNPDGRLVDPATLVALAARVGTLLVDEAFMDALDPGSSVVPYLLPRGMIVLRSFGKFYGLAGLRLGFALGAPDLVLALRERLGPWAVSGPALSVGTRALDETDWQEASRLRLVAEAARLDGLLARAGLAPVDGTPLFRLASHPRAAALFEALAEAGILVRPFAHRSDWLRFGLPGSAAAWERLAMALAAFAG